MINIIIRQFDYLKLLTEYNALYYTVTDIAIPLENVKGAYISQIVASFDNIQCMRIIRLTDTLRINRDEECNNGYISVFIPLAPVHIPSCQNGRIPRGSGSVISASIFTITCAEPTIIIELVLNNSLAFLSDSIRGIDICNVPCFQLLLPDMNNHTVPYIIIDDLATFYLNLVPASTNCCKSKVLLIISINSPTCIQSLLTQLHEQSYICDIIIWDNIGSSAVYGREHMNIFYYCSPVNIGDVGKVILSYFFRAFYEQVIFVGQGICIRDRQAVEKFTGQVRYNLFHISTTAGYILRDLTDYFNRRVIKDNSVGVQFIDMNFTYIPKHIINRTFLKWVPFLARESILYLLSVYVLLYTKCKYCIYDIDIDVGVGVYGRRRSREGFAYSLKYLQYPLHIGEVYRDPCQLIKNERYIISDTMSMALIKYPKFNYTKNAYNTLKNPHIYIILTLTDKNIKSSDIDRCLNSISDQTVKNYSVCIVNDVFQLDMPVLNLLSNYINTHPTWFYIDGTNYSGTYVCRDVALKKMNIEPNDIVLLLENTIELINRNVLYIMRCAYVRDNINITCSNIFIHQNIELFQFDNINWEQIYTSRAFSKFTEFTTFQKLIKYDYRKLANIHINPFKYLFSFRYKLYTRLDYRLFRPDDSEFYLNNIFIYNMLELHTEHLSTKGFKIFTKPLCRSLNPCILFNTKGQCESNIRRRSDTSNIVSQLSLHYQYDLISNMRVITDDIFPLSTNKYYVFTSYKNCEYLNIIFVENGTWNTIQSYYNLFQNMNTSTLFIRDDDNYFLAGIPGCSINIKTTTEYLRRQIKLSHCSKVCLYGTNGAGYSSIVYGLQLGDCTVYATNPHTHIDTDVGARFTVPWKRRMIILNNYNEYIFDLLHYQGTRLIHFLVHPTQNYTHHHKRMYSKLNAYSYFMNIPFVSLINRVSSKS